MVYMVCAGGGYPIQETTVVGPPKPPELYGVKEDTDDLEVEVDEAKKKSSPASPPDDMRHKTRMKRLAKFESDKTGQGPFEEGSMVQVDSFGCGVVKWIGVYPKTDKLTAGIEFVSYIVWVGECWTCTSITHSLDSKRWSSNCYTALAGVQ
jgi:hypothetical protein